MALSDREAELAALILKLRQVVTGPPTGPDSTICIPTGCIVTFTRLQQSLQIAADECCLP